MITNRSKLKPEVTLQYAGHLILETSSIISAVDRDTSSKFGMQTNFGRLTRLLSLNLKPEVDFRFSGHHLENRYDVITMLWVVRFRCNLVGQCKMTHR